MSRIVTGKFQLEMQPVVLGPVLPDAVAAFRSAAEAHGIAIDTVQPDRFPENRECPS